MKVKIQDPGLPDGYEIALTGLPCLLINNQDVEVSDEAIAEFELTTGKDFKDVLRGKKFGGEGRSELYEKPLSQNGENNIQYRGTPNEDVDKLPDGDDD